MAKVYVEVEYSPNDIDLSFVLPECNNISGNTISQLSEGARPFLLGASKLGFTDRFWDSTKKYDGFISRACSNSTGNTNLTITVKGNAVDRFVINFDKAALQYATELEVNGVKYSNNANRFIWSGIARNSHRVIIKKWNSPKYPIRITSIRVGLTVVYDSSMLQELVRGSQCVSNNKEPMFGAISQYGNMTIVDNDGELLRLAEQGMLKPDLAVRIFFGDLPIGNFTSEKWSYIVNNNKVTVSLNDSIVKWQAKNFDGTDMKENVTAWEIYETLRAATSEKIALGDGVESYLKSLRIKYCELYESKLSEGWNKLCNLCRLIMYKDELGTVRLERWL